MDFKTGLHACPHTLQETFPGLQLHCHYRFVSPEAETLFFVHGLGCSLNNWRFLFAENLFRGQNLFAFDLPGFGDSDKPVDFPYTLEAHGRAAGELLALYSSSFSLVEYSESGRLMKQFRAFPGKKAYIYGQRNAGAEILNQLDGILCHQVPESGHSMMVENPEALCSIIDEIISN